MTDMLLESSQYCLTMNSQHESWFMLHKAMLMGHRPFLFDTFLSLTGQLTGWSEAGPLPSSLQTRTVRSGIRYLPLLPSPVKFQSQPGWKGALFPPVRNAHVVCNEKTSFALEFGGCLTIVRTISKLAHKSGSLLCDCSQSMSRTHKGCHQIWNCVLMKKTNKQKNSNRQHATDWNWCNQSRSAIASSL